MRSLSTHFLLFTTVLATGLCNHQFGQAKHNHQLQLGSYTDLQYLASTSDTNHFNKVLDHILIPRVVGTENHEKVVKYIVKDLRRLKWHVKIDEFKQKAPILGTLTFKNIIATLNPHAERYLVLACHYDSKYFPNDVFLGAIDSAVPCAMMLNLAQTLAKELNEAKRNDVSLKLLFFDGEEAFEEWGPNDSIYGAKHLAKIMENNQTVSRLTKETVNDLQRIDVLVLLDLIGAKNPAFHNFFQNTAKWFVRLAEIEKLLDEMSLLPNHYENYFKRTPPFGHIEDDHIPFLIRQVPVLHLITAPFPPEWHTPNDNREIINMDTVNNINLILRVFVSEYLHLWHSPFCWFVPFLFFVLLIVMLFCKYRRYLI